MDATGPSPRSLADARPVSAEERLPTLDVLRGMALLGVLVANVWFWFSGLFLRIAEFRPELSRPTLDSAAYHLVSVFVSGRAISVFSFLFGVGLAVQALRAEARGADVVPLYRRRMAVLLGIGVAHGVLFWYGDILAVYALLGFVLLLFRRRSDRTLLAWAAVLLVAVPLAWTAWTVLTRDTAAPAAAGAAAAAAAQRTATLEAFQSVRPDRIVPENLRWIRHTYLGPIALAIFPPVFGCFLLGLWAGRRRVFERVSGHAAAFRRLMVWGLGVGLTTGVAYEVVRTTVGSPTDARPWVPLVLSVLHVLAVVPLAAGGVSATVLLLEHPAWRRRLGVFAPVGRMALTHYLSQTVICLVIFYGGGLVGRVGVAAALAISLAVFAVQMAWSPWWLARFHFGPMEWAWRSLTYGHPQPMRIRVPAVRPGLAA
ncbi:MAG: DUF418 domain-containing protein [Longimicrobiaceae bacterium]